MAHVHIQKQFLTLGNIWKTSYSSNNTKSRLLRKWINKLFNQTRIIMRISSNIYKVSLNNIHIFKHLPISGTNWRLSIATFNSRLDWWPQIFATYQISNQFTNFRTKLISAINLTCMKKSVTLPQKLFNEMCNKRRIVVSDVNLLCRYELINQTMSTFYETWVRTIQINFLQYIIPVTRGKSSKLTRNMLVTNIWQH